MSFAITPNLCFVQAMKKYFFLIIHAFVLYIYVYISVLKLLQYNTLKYTV